MNETQKEEKAIEKPSEYTLSMRVGSKGLSPVKEFKNPTMKQREEESNKKKIENEFISKQNSKVRLI